MMVETKIEPCGTIVYSALCAPHDWTPKPLNPQGHVTAFAKKLGDVRIGDRIWRQEWWGHRFSDGSLCSGECA